MSTVLVTGAAGFIGSATAKALLDDGHEVVGIDCLTDYYDTRIKTAALASIPCDRFTFVPADLLGTDLDALLRGVDRVVHLAGQPGVRSSWGADFELHTSRNVLATQALLEATRRSSHIERFVYASSSSVYGNALSHPTPETATPRPVSPYGVTKLAGEHLARLYASNYGVPTTSLRYFTVYGPGQRPDMAFTRFTRAAVLGDEISLFGTGAQIRDFTFVDDVVRANLAALFGASEPGVVFNVAGGSKVSMNEVIATLGDLVGEPLAVRRHGTVAGDVFRTGGCTAAITEQLGWRPRVSLSDGLERHLDWARRSFAPLVAA